MMRRFALGLVFLGILFGCLPARAFIIIPSGPAIPLSSSNGLQAQPSACLQAIPGACLRATPDTPAVTFFMAPSGTDGAGCGVTSGSPCATPNGVAAHNALVCGNVISAAAGAYGSSAMLITATPSCPAQNDVVMIKCATAFACTMSNTPIKVAASYWGIQGFAITGATPNNCILVEPNTSTTNIGTIALVNNVCNGAQFDGIATLNNGSASVGNVIIMGNIVFAAAKTGVGCDAGISVGLPNNFLASGDEIYKGWNFSYGNITTAGSCNGGTNSDQAGIKDDSMFNYTGATVNENNWLGWNGGPGYELTSFNASMNAGPVIARYNTLVANVQFASIAGGSNTDFISGIVGVGEQNVDFESNLVSANSTVSGATGLNFGPHNTPLSLMDNNFLFQSVTGHGDNYWGDASVCLAGNTCSNAGSTGNQCAAIANTNNTGCSGNSFATDPVLVSLTEPGAPSCSGQPDVLTCFATQIANLVSSAVGSTTKGAQVATPTDAYNTTPFLCHVYHEMPATMFTSGGGPIPNRC